MHVTFSLGLAWIDGLDANKIQLRRLAIRHDRSGVNLAGWTNDTADALPSGRSIRDHRCEKRVQY